MDTNRCVKLVLMLVLAISFMLNSIPISNVVGQPELKPTEGWGMFFETNGDINITIDEPGVAVRIELPREFLEGVISKSNRQLNNDTYFIRSDISSDYYYYTINDTSEYYPYNENGPYNITIQKPPEYICSNVSITSYYQNFTPPKYAFLEGLRAPQISGIYNVSVYIAPNVNTNTSSMDYGEPIFSAPPEIFQIHVSMREDPSHIFGFIRDEQPLTPIIIDTKGIVYAIEVNTGMIGRGFVDPNTGFFNVTGLYAGEYRLEGSAGYFPTTGFAYAPTLSQTTYIVGKGVGVNVNFLPLDRGFILNGSLQWVNQLNSSINPLDPQYYLGKIGITNLNYTVEAYDDSGKIVASDIYKSNNVPSEMYQLILRNGTKYFSYPALGSEYSGFGPGTYTIKIWAYGFVMRDHVTVGPLIGRGYPIDIGSTKLQIGGVITGKIRLRSGPLGQLETPREGELNSFGSQTGKLFGGNILIQLYNSQGALKGLTVLKRTNETLDLPSRTPNGTVLYADYSSGDQPGAENLLKFYILGFSEFHNKTYSGSWQIGSFPGPSPWDYGLEAGTYYVKISIRGYVQEEINVFTLDWGSNVTQVIDLRRGGSTTVTVTSNVVRPGTRWPQSPTEFWRFIDEDTQEPSLCPPPRIRIYFYSSLGSEVGYAETILYSGGAGVLNNTAILNFSGHNWLIDDIIYRGFVPNALVADDYTLRAHTYGYIHAEDITITISLSQFSPSHVGVAFPLLLGCFIGGGVDFAMNDIFLSLTEDTPIWTHAIFDGTTLMGTYVVDAQTDWPGFIFTTYGFYGRGHFFYVDPQGYRWKDYGLENGTYNVVIPEFGFTRRFLQEVDTSTSLAELGWGSEVFFSLERLVKISGNIQGYNKDRIPVVLVWATIDTDGRTSYSFDGDFHIHVPSGTYDVTFSSPGYISQSRTGTSNDQVGLGIIVLEQSGDPFP